MEAVTLNRGIEYKISLRSSSTGKLFEMKIDTNYISTGKLFEMKIVT
jgi:hypothetical protein